MSDENKIKTIPGFSNYAITKDGRVWSKPIKNRGCGNKRGRWLKLGLHSSGYLGVSLCTNSKKYTCDVHRLILETYVGSCPPDKEACHDNGNKQDNRLENLRWDTRSNNHLDAVRHGTHIGLFPQKRKICKLTADKVRVIRYLRDVAKFILSDLAWQFDVHISTICGICKRKRWKNI